MTKIKICGLKTIQDIEYVNRLMPEYVGFVFVKESKRYITCQKAKEMKSFLNDKIICIGVFVNEPVLNIAQLVNEKVIDAVQLHGNEDEEYINHLRKLIKCPIIKAFCIKANEDIYKANVSGADYVLLDSGAGGGITFNWDLTEKMHRPYFLAGGISADNVNNAIGKLNPYAVDVSSSLEENGCKNIEKMTAFVNAVRKRKD